jgi:hypothetical protein
MRSATLDLLSWLTCLFVASLFEAFDCLSPNRLATEVSVPLPLKEPVGPALIFFSAPLSSLSRLASQDLRVIRFGEFEDFEAVGRPGTWEPAEARE